MTKKKHGIAPRERLRQYWIGRTPEVLEMVTGIVAGLPSREEIEDICPYWHHDYFDLAERAVRHYRQNANELIRVSQVFLKCVEQPFDGIEKSEDVFMKRIGTLVGELTADREIIVAVKGVRIDLVRGELQAEPEALQAIARAKGGQPSVS